MTLARQVLVVDRAEGSFAGVMEELDQLGFRVIWVPTLRAALDFVRASDKLSLLIASASAADDGGADFLTQLKEIRPSLRVIWGAHPTATATPAPGARPHSLIPEPFRPDALRSTVAALLAEHFYPHAIAGAIKGAALEVLGSLGEFKVEGGAFLIANQTALSDLSSIISFSGEASGHLMVGMSNDHARALYERFVPGARIAAVDRLEDLVGELCNRILGRINSFFAQHAMSVQQTTPIFIRAAGSTMRYPGRRPSFGVQLTRGDVRVSVEYYLADFNLSKLEQGVTGDVVSIGEIRYL